MTYSKEYIDRAEEVILHTYNRFQIVLDKGNGVQDRKSTRLNSSHIEESRMPSSA